MHETVVTCIDKISSTSRVYSYCLEAMQNAVTHDASVLYFQAGYLSQVTWPRQKFQNGSPFHKPHMFTPPHNPDNKPLLVITSASTPSSPLVVSNSGGMNYQNKVSQSEKLPTKSKCQTWHKTSQ